MGECSTWGGGGILIHGDLNSVAKSNRQIMGILVEWNNRSSLIFSKNQFKSSLINERHMNSYKVEKPRFCSLQLRSILKFNPLQKLS